MKKIFTSMWLQLLTVVIITAAPGFWKYLGIVFAGLYFIIWCGVQFNFWLQEERAKQKN
jgi:hypothetical protein